MGKEVDSISYVVPREHFESWPILPSEKPLISPRLSLGSDLIGSLRKARLSELAGHVGPLLRIQADLLSFFRMELHGKLVGVIQSPDGTLRQIAAADEENDRWYPRFVRPSDLYFVVKSGNGHFLTEADGIAVPQDMVALGPVAKIYKGDPLLGVSDIDEQGGFFKIPNEIRRNREGFWGLAEEGAYEGWPSVHDVNLVGHVTDFRRLASHPVAARPIQPRLGGRINPEEVAGVTSLTRELRRTVSSGLYEGDTYSQTVITPFVVLTDGTYCKIERPSSDSFPRFNRSRDKRPSIPITTYMTGDERADLFIDLYRHPEDAGSAILRITRWCNDDLR